MKILLYIDMLHRGGAQRVMSNLAAHFSEKHDVVLVNDFLPDPQRAVYAVPDNVKRVYLQESLSGNVIVKNIKRIVRLRKIVKAENPDVVLSFLGAPNKRMLISTVGLKCRRFVSVRNDPNYEYGSGKINRIIAKLFFTLADGVVFQTEDAAKYFQASVRKKSTVIFNPVAKVFRDTERSQELKNIVTVGRFDPQKNHILLLEAWKELEGEFPDEKLVIYGDGALRAQYEKYISDNGLGDRVELPGVVTDVPSVLSKARLFVLSSDFEGMPNALMEAMSVGVPCISTDCPCGGPKMLIDDGKDGYLVPCKDITALKSAICNALRYENLELVGIASKMKSEMFEPETVYSAWEAFLLG